MKVSLSIPRLAHLFFINQAENPIHVSAKPLSPFLGSKLSAKLRFDSLSELPVSGNVFVRDVLRYGANHSLQHRLNQPSL